MSKETPIYIENNTQEPLDPMVCELTVMMHEKLRYTRFISTKELEKLWTCHNLEQLDKYIQLEQEIFQDFFEKYPKLSNQANFSKIIPLQEKYFDLLKLIEQFTSSDYLRTLEKWNEDKTFTGVKIEVNTHNNKKYLAWVELVFKNKKWPK